MVTELARYWWVIAIRGLFAIVFGILAFVWPGITLAALILLFGAYALVDGIFSLIGGFRMAGREGRWWVMVLEGVAGVAVGLLTFFYPGLTAIVLLYFIAAWAVITGVLEIIAAIRLRKEIEGEFWMALAGIASVIFGVLLFVQPGAGALAVLWIIGVYAILFGVFLILLAFRLRGAKGQGPTAAPSA